jgi:hypothetical protein
MRYKTIEPFVPSGGDFQKSKELFLDLGFEVVWEAGGMAGFSGGDCRFILQKYDDKHFAENFMVRVGVENLDEFWAELGEKDLPSKYGVQLKEPTNFPWGREVNLIDIAGVCWHFAENK